MTCEEGKHLLHCFCRMLLIAHDNPYDVKDVIISTWKWHENV